MTASYVDMLKQEFSDRKKRRPHYSERAFARDLDLSCGFISLLFNGKRSLSPRTSLKIVNKLNWTEVRSKKFIEAVQAEQLFKPKKSNKEKKLVEEYELQTDHFLLLSNIYHFVVLELIQSRENCSSESIAHYFQLDQEECEIILERLERLGMVYSKNKIYKASLKNRKLLSTPSEAIRNYHRQAINLALDSIESQDFSKRELRALTLSIDPKKIDKAKASINKFSKEFNAKFGNKKNGEVYQLNLQLFSHGYTRKEEK